MNAFVPLICRKEQVIDCIDNYQPPTTCSHLSWKMQIFVKHGAKKLHNLKKISTLLFFHFFYFSITAQAELSPDSAHKKI